MNPAAIVFVVVTTAPPLPPAEAARVLQSSKSVLDRTNVYVLTPEDEALRPPSTGTRSKAGDGPFGPFPKQEFRPLGVHYVHGITFRIPHGRQR